ncbi:MAG: siderophore-interacting protein [Acidimicrobiales bacterium]
MTDAHRDRLRQMRREPPPLQPVAVVARLERSPRLLRITLAGDGLRDLVVEQPASSVRLLIPSPGAAGLQRPEWDGNQYLLADGSRAVLRTFTPVNHDRGEGRLDLDIVRHPGGAVSTWAETVEPGSPAAISGPARGYEPDPTATRLLVLGDETALPAAAQVVAAAGRTEVHLEVAEATALIDMAGPADRPPTWHVTEPGARPGWALVGVVQQLTALDPGTRVWAAGEAAAMQAIRTHLFGTLGVARSQAEVRGYWKARNPTGSPTPM